MKILPVSAAKCHLSDRGVLGLALEGSIFQNSKQCHMLFTQGSHKKYGIEKQIDCQDPALCIAPDGCFTGVSTCKHKTTL